MKEVPTIYSKLPGGAVEAAFRRCVESGYPVDRRRRIELRRADLPFGQRMRPASDDDDLPVRSRVLDLYAVKSSLEVRDEVVVAVLSERNRDSAASTSKVGRDHQLGEVTFRLQRSHAPEPTTKTFTYGARKCANSANSLCLGLVQASCSTATSLTW